MQQYTDFCRIAAGGLVGPQRRFGYFLLGIFLLTADCAQILPVLGAHSSPLSHSFPSPALRGGHDNSGRIQQRRELPGQLAALVRESSAENQVHEEDTSPTSLIKATSETNGHHGGQSPFATNHPGWYNVYAPVKRFRVMDEMDVMAPENSLGEYTRPRNQQKVTAMTLPLYIPPDLYPDPFPDKNVTVNRTMPVNATCTKSPGGWSDKNGVGCPAYQMHQWCTPDGKEGPGIEPGKIEEWGTGGITALSACCECGGGMTKVIFGDETPLNERRIDASMDRMPAHAYPAVQAPEDRDRPWPVVAPMDTVPRRFARYIEQVYDRVSAPDLSGLSLEWFDNDPGGADASTAPPADGKPPAEMKARSSRIDATVDSGFGSFTKPSPYWPRSLGPAPQLYFVRWSGSLVIHITGNYSFRVDLDGIRTVEEGNYSKTSIGGNEVNTMSGEPQAMEPGAYCVQIDVKMFPQVHGVRFMYKGPDSQNRMTVVPSPMLYCNPTIQACVKPAIDACGAEAPVATP